MTAIPPPLMPPKQDPEATVGVIQYNVEIIDIEAGTRFTMALVATPEEAQRITKMMNGGLPAINPNLGMEVTPQTVDVPFSQRKNFTLVTYLVDSKTGLATHKVEGTVVTPVSFVADAALPSE